MQERDVERGEVAHMAAQADEATRAAQDMKMQLDRVSWNFFCSIVLLSVICYNRRCHFIT